MGKDRGRSALSENSDNVSGLGIHSHHQGKSKLGFCEVRGALLYEARFPACPSAGLEEPTLRATVAIFRCVRIDHGEVSEEFGSHK